MNIELRDFFAAKAMQSFVALDHMALVDLAKEAYEVADAMLAAREVGKPKEDDAGWIEWNGGECPVAPEAIVEFRRPLFVSKAFAWQLRWSHKGRADDIIAYRVVQP